MKAFKELLQKKLKEGKFLSEDDIEAKKSVLSELKSDMEKQLAENLKGIKKVVVTSNSPEGLKEGLEKAKEIVKSAPEMEKVADMDDEEELEEHEDKEELKEHKDEEELSEEEIDKKLADLMAKKEKLKKLKG
jgi:hypothetical protein